MQLPENFYLELHSYIEALPYTISQRGKDIVSKNLMDSIVYNPKKSEITTKVYGNEIYDVVISLDADEFTISDTTCSCTI